LVVPPDGTRPHADAGVLTQIVYEEAGGAGTFNVMPAIGTHYPMSELALRRMFGPAIPKTAFVEHNWREDLAALGTVPAEFVHKASGNALSRCLPDCDIPVEVNKRLVDGGYSAIFSIGQVVPHEVAGMANGFKNILVGTGGVDTINKSHFLGAAYGMERMMGRADTPVRRVLNYAHEHYLKGLGVVYIMTVIGRDESGRMVMRGLYVGDDMEAFELAAALSRQVNVTLFEEPQERVVAYLQPGEFQSTWLGNKAIYRTRMAIADGGELTVLAPDVRTFGEDPEIDHLVRLYGYRGTPATLRAVAENAELRSNLCAAAHLIHGSSEGRFRIVYATNPSLLSCEEVEAAGFEWRSITDALREYPAHRLPDGPNEGFYYVSCPALGLWATKDRFVE
jgi:nickel-dependent lactate racemase